MQRPRKSHCTLNISTNKRALIGNSRLVIHIDDLSVRRRDGFRTSVQ
jgi:hypothetical protein